MKRRIVTLITLLLVILWAAIGTYFVLVKWDVKEIAKNQIKQESKAEQPVVETLSLITAGDALIHDGVYNAAKTSNGYDFKPMFKYVKEIVEPYDLANYNQETILGGSELGLSNWPRFNSPKEVGDGLIDAGFNIVGRANNHTLDSGEDAILSAEDYWSKQKDVLTAGSYISETARQEVKIKEVNGISYAFLNYTTLTNGLSAPSGKDYYVDVYDKEKVKADIERIGDKADVLIVAMHWGTEFVFTPVQSQKDIANYLSSLGVDIIIGTHPHVVEPVQYVNNTLVIYSLGNLISAHETSSIMKRVGLLVSLDITKTTYKGETTIKISNIEGTLTFNPSRTTEGRYIVYPFNKLDSSILKNYKDVYKEYSNYVKVDDTITIKPLSE